MPPLLPWGFAQELKEHGATSLSGYRLAQIHFRVRIDRTPREQDSNQWVARVPSVMAARRGSMLETAAPCRVYELRRLLRTEMRGHCAGAVHRSRSSDRCRVCIRVRMRSVLSGALTHSPSCRPCLFELTCLCAVPATDRSSGSEFPFSARARARRRARARAFVAPGPEPELCFRFPWADVSSFGLAVTWAWVRSASHVRIRPACVNGVAGRVPLLLLAASALSPVL